MLTVDVIGRAESSTGQTWPQARLLADAHGKAAVWEGGHNGRNTPVWSAREAAVTPGSTPGTWHVTAAGTTVTVVKSGCGCGTPLRALGEMDLATLVVPA